MRQDGKEYEVGDYACLKVPERGYRNVEVIGYDWRRIVVRTSSGYEFSVYEDELE
jgi:hypothetical protein